VPDKAEWLRGITAAERRLLLGMRRRLQESRISLQTREQRLARSHPGIRLRQHAQRLDELEGRARLAIRTRLERARARLGASSSLLLRASPALRVAALRIRLESARRALAGAARGRIAEARRQFELAARTLHTVSPLATLDRGYAIVTDTAGHVLQDATAVRPGDSIEARLARGRVRAAVVATAPDRDDEDRPA
jgi:exodeoxyribonuclease VII large subunit